MKFYRREPTNESYIEKTKKIIAFIFQECYIRDKLKQVSAIKTNV